MIVNTEYILRFRWVVCQLDALQGCLKPRQIRNALKSLPKTLDETYAQILASIPEEHSEDARRILQCLITAFYPLDVKEVAEIVAINPSEDPIIDFDNKLYDPQDVLTICSSLVSVIPSTRIKLKENFAGAETFSFHELRLAHYSVKEYLISNRVESALAPMYSIDERLAHDAMAGFCIRYLLQFDQDDLRRGLPGSQYGLLESALFAPYATRCWGRHFRAAAPDMSSLIHKHALALLKEPKIVRNALKLQKPWWDRRDYFETSGFLAMGFVNPLYHASMQGLTSLVTTLLDLNYDVDSPGPSGTALAAACSEGHVDVIQMLLRAGANIDLEPIDFEDRSNARSTPLRHAVLTNRVHVVRLLLAEGADIHRFSGKGYKRTPVHNAVLYAKINVARILISAGADVNKIGTKGDQTPLQLACSTGDEEMFNLVLSAGARVNDEHDYGGNSFTLAICGGNMSIIHKLQSLGARLDLRQKDDFVYSYLLEKIGNAQARARDLLSMNVFQDPQEKAFVQSSLLRVAVRKGFEDLVSMMLHIGTDVNSQDYSGKTPLVIAAELATSGNLFLIRLLLQHGADVNKVDGKECSALHAAATFGNADAVDLLLENGADVNCVSGEGSVLTLATEVSNLPRVKSDINERARHQAVIDTLLAHGAQAIPPPLEP